MDVKEAIYNNFKISNLLEGVIKQLPQEPGCYLMKDKQSNILYIGKSKKLRTRVRSYFRDFQNLTPRLRLMVKQITDIEYIVTDSETEALTLESNLIKSYQPYFNVLLKDDKKYPYLCITWSDTYPRIFITRRRRDRNLKDRYYGPYVDVTLLRKILFLIKKVFPLRQRPRPLYKDRPCLNFSIGRCPGVCQGLISPEEYKATLKKVEMIFQGRSNELNNLLIEQMNIYSSKLEYEKAAILRDQIKAIDHLWESQKMIIPDSTISRDIIGLASDSKISCIQIFQMRAGKLVGRLGYTANTQQKSNKYILQKIIIEHYSQVDPLEIPFEINVQVELPDQNLISEWLSELRERKVNILLPKKLQKAEFIELVIKNANYELSRIKQGHEKQLLALEDLCQLLELNELPKRIEGYDISHIQGSDAVGSQVVFVEGISAKQHYRKYKIHNSEIKIGHSDDYKALSEVIKRRFNRWSRYKKENGHLNLLHDQKKTLFDPLGLSDWPDLVLIDGGKGQLKAVMDTLKLLDLHEDVNICSLAKKKEQVFVPETKKPLLADPNQLGVLLLRQIRDEAHRFAINFHRQQRGERMKKSQLSEINGLGPKRIKELLSNFKSIEAIQLASIKDLSSTKGFNKKIAEEVWLYFHRDQKD